MSLKIHTVILAYTVIREVEVFSSEDMTPAEIEAKAKEVDIDLNPLLPATIIYMRRTLKAAECKVTNIRSESV